jgi:hypothetical protein
MTNKKIIKDRFIHDNTRPAKKRKWLRFLTKEYKIVQKVHWYQSQIIIIKVSVVFRIR